jgi:hypothetical protein
MLNNFRKSIAILSEASIIPTPEVCRDTVFIASFIKTLQVFKKLRG